jgi:tetratricopeptide (TPR) repeat protein
MHSMSVAERTAEEHGHAFSIAWALASKGRVLWYHGRYREAIETSDQAIELCRQMGFNQRLGQALFNRGRAKAKAVSPDDGLSDMYEALETWRAPGTVFHVPEMLLGIAEAHLMNAEIDLAMNRISEASEIIDRTG